MTTETPLAANLLAGDGAAQIGSGTDTALLALAPEFDARWAAEREAERGSDEELTAACQHTGAIARQIADTEASSLAGLQLKARAIAWCFSAETPAFSGEHQVPDAQRWADKFFSDLLSMTAIDSLSSAASVSGTQAATQPAANADLEPLLQELAAATADFDSKINLSDDVYLGREPTAEEMALFNAAHEREARAVQAVFDHRSTDTASLLAKIAALAPQRVSEGLQKEIITALAADAAQLAMPPVGTDAIRKDWAEIVARREEVQAAERAARVLSDASPTDEALAEAAEDLFEEEGRVIAQLGLSIAPDAASLVRKWTEHLAFQGIGLGTLDDRLCGWLDRGDRDEVERATLYLDTARLARRQDADVPLTPRALNRYLAFLGCKVGPLAFGFPDGAQASTVQFLGELKPQEVTGLFAAAWIEAYLAAGAHVSLMNGEPHFYRPLAPPIAEVDRLLDLLDERSELSAAVRDQVAATMAARQVVLLAASALDAAA